MDRSHHRRGLALVMAGALLGAISGVTLGLAVGDTQGPPTSAGLGREQQTAVAASSPSTPPASSLEASSGGRSDGDNPIGEQRAKSPDRAKKQQGKPGKDKGGRDKSKDPGKDNNGKAKTKKKP